MRAVHAMAACLIVAYAPPALADWEWTQWGMTRNQAHAASRGKATQPSAKDKQRRMYRRGFMPVQVPELVADTRTGESDVQAYLLFDVTTARLACVDLVPKEGAALWTGLRDNLTATYGQPVSEQRKELPGVTWTTTTWVSERDTIELQQGGLGNKLKYCERAKDAVAELR